MNIFFIYLIFLLEYKNYKQILGIDKFIHFDGTKCAGSYGLL